jgi:hypothetical protein
MESEYRVLAWVAGLPPPHPKLRARAKDDLKARARELRRRGRTYPEIAETLGVSKSSCSLWCHDLQHLSERVCPGGDRTGRAITHVATPSGQR